MCQALCSGKGSYDPCPWDYRLIPGSGIIHLPNPGIELAYLLSPALAGGFFTTSATWEALARCSQAVSTSLNMDMPRKGRRVLILRNSSQDCEKPEKKEDGCFLGKILQP